MNSPTAQYEFLLKSLRGVSKIVRGVNERECSTDLQHLKLQSYLFLCHAIFEEYLEEIGKIIAREACRKFAREGKITKALVALIAANLIEELGNRSKKKISSDLVSNIEVFSNEAYLHYESVVKGNHGIRIHNQNNVLIPIGIDLEKTDPALAASWTPAKTFCASGFP